MKRRGFVGALLAGLLVVVRPGSRRPRQVWDIAIPGHQEEFLALGYQGVTVNGRKVSAQRIDLARGEVEAFARDANGKVITTDGRLIREILRGRVELLREARA